VDKINLKSYFLNQATKEFFFAFLVILLIILIYGLFQPDAGLSFFVPEWKKLFLILSATGVFGVLGVFTNRYP